MATLELRNLSIRRRGASDVGPINVAVAPGKPVALVDHDRSALDSIAKALADDSGIRNGDIVLDTPTRRITRIGAPLLKPSRHSVERLLRGELKRSRLPKEMWEAHLESALGLVGLERHREWRLHDLSEGLLLRASLAAALVTQPEAVVIDQPQALAPNMPLEECVHLFQDLSRKLQAPVLFLCGSLKEAFLFCSEIVLLDHGSMLQAGPSIEVYRRPLNRACAAMGGDANFLTGRVLRTGAGFILAETGAGRIQAAASQGSILEEGQPVTIMLRPEAIKLERVMADDDCLPGEIERVVFRGPTARYWFRTGTVTLQVDEAHPRYPPGFAGPLHALIDPDDAVALAD